MNIGRSKIFIGLLLVSMAGVPMYADHNQAENRSEGLGLFTSFKTWFDGLVNRYTRVDASFALPAVTIVASGLLLVGFLKSFKASTKRTAREQAAESQRSAQDQPNVRQTRWQKTKTTLKNTIARWRKGILDGFQGLYNVANVPVAPAAGGSQGNPSNVLTPEQLLNAAAAGSRTGAQQNAESLFA